MGELVQLLPGTLHLLILKAVSLGPRHGHGALLRIEQISRGALLLEQGVRVGTWGTRAGQPERGIRATRSR